MLLGIFRNLLQDGFLIFTFFAFLWGSKCAKKCDFLSKFYISDQKLPFWHFSGPIKMKKADFWLKNYNLAKKSPFLHFQAL